MRRLLIAAAVAGAFASPGTAQGAITVGSSLRVRADLFIRCNTTCSSVQSTRPGGTGLVIPEDGVLTRWRVRSATLGTLRLRVFRREEDGGYTSVAIGPEVTLDRSHQPGQDVLYEFPVRIPVHAGDTIGVDRDGKAGGIFHSYGTNASYAVADYAPKLADDAIDVQPTTTSTGRELLLNADVETDADGDGFGDESQDNCPTVPNDQTDKPCTMPTPTQSPSEPTSTTIPNTTPQHQQGSEGPPVSGERGATRGIRHHRGGSPPRRRPPSPSDPQRRHARSSPPRAKPPRPTGPNSSPHDSNPPARPTPPRSNAPAPGEHGNTPGPRPKPKSKPKPVSRHDGRAPRPNPPATEPPTGQPHDQSGPPRSDPKAKPRKPVKRHHRSGSRPAPPPAQGAPGWQHH